jgi:hypothetical protein
MTNQPLARRSLPGHLMPQGSNSSLAQLAEMGAVTLICQLGWHETYVKIQAELNQPGRSEAEQRQLAQFSASLFTEFTQGVTNVHRQALFDFINHRPVREVEVTRIVEVPQKGFVPRLFGR